MQRFWDKVNMDVEGENSCWEWTAAKGNPEGHGRFFFKGRLWVASRLAYMLTHADFDENLNICHKCDNPPCCRPDHLFQGTQADNLQDMTRKGRHWNNKGSKSPNAKLTESDVLAIRSLKASGDGPKKIAAMFGINPSNVSNIIARRAWKHI